MTVTVTGRNRERCTVAIFQKSLNLVAGFCRPEIGNEVDNTTVSQLVRTKKHLAKGGYRYIYIVHDIDPQITLRLG